MNKGLKIFGKVLLGILAALVVFLVVMFVYNKVQIQKEAVVFDNPVGEFVEVDGKKMCVYAEGEGEHTFVFLSGSGTASPILDFKSIYSRLADDYRVVVIEKFGYGFSDVSGAERDFDTILRQDREALSKLGIEGPFILCPHSMSGLEAIMWAQQFPQDVEGIVGLDMAAPEHYEAMQMSEGMDNLVYAVNGALRELGLLRLFKDSDIITSSVLSDEEIKIYRQIAYARILNADVKSEGGFTDEACDEINSSPMPGVPMILFVSDGTGGTPMDKDSWRGCAHDFASRCTNANVVELDCPHYVHNYETDRIESDMRAFAESL